MIVSIEEINSWDSKFRLKFINSVSGYKGVHLIGTKGGNGISNLAIFNSIVHISSEPARIGFIMRPLSVTRDTYDNIKNTSYYTINHVHKSFLKKAHFTSAKFDTDESEFELCNLTEQYTKEFQAPFVEESSIKIGLKLTEDIEIKSSGCRLIVGEVQFIEVNEEYIEDDGQIDLEQAHDICVTGLNQYSSVKKHINIPYARKTDLPNFKRKERPDNIVFDEKSQSYNAKILPYGTTVGSASISTNNLSTWKARGVTSYNHVLKNKIDQIKNEYDRLIEEYKTNELIYNAKYQFEPIIGEEYHLYKNDNKNEVFLSMIPPNTWKKTHIGSYTLNSDKTWTQTQ